MAYEAPPLLDHLVFFTSLPEVGGHATISLELAKLLRPLFSNITVIAREMPGHGTSQTAVEMLQELGTKTISLAGRNLLADMGRLFVNNKTCLRRPDVFLAMGMRHLSPLIAIASRAKRSYYYHITHELDNSTLRRLDWYSTAFSSLLFISPATERLWNSKNNTRIPTRSLVQPIGDAASIRRRRSSDTRISFGFIGRLNQGKGSHVVASFAENCPVSCRIRVAGGGDYAAMFENLSSTDNRPVRVRYDGSFSVASRNSYFADFFGDIDYLIVPSQDDREGIPTVILESLRAGVPVVATQTGGMRAFADMEFGDVTSVRLVEPNQFAEELFALASAPPPTDALRESCRAYFEKTFSNQMLLSRWQQVLLDL